MKWNKGEPKLPRKLRVRSSNGYCSPAKGYDVVCTYRVVPSTDTP